MREFTEPGEIKLWTLFQENGESITGLTDLTVEVKDVVGNVILSSTTLVEEGSSSVYSYTWDASSVSIGSLAIAYFKKAGKVLFAEEYFFEIVEDMDGQAL